MIRVPTSCLALAATLALAGCNVRTSNDPVTVSVIGEASEKLPNPDREPLTTPDAVLLAATAQGLVRHDATGQIEPGLAIRWAISDDGLYYTFRLASIEGLGAEDVARQLRSVIAANSRNPMKPLLGAINEIVAVTPEVVEIRLNAARPNLLDLLAQPELTLPGKKDVPDGPFRIAGRTGRVFTLSLVDREFSNETPDETERRRRQVFMHAERAGRAVARFQQGKADLVIGGRYDSLAIAQAARPRETALRYDPAPGMFGLAFVERAGFLAAPENRRALAMAIDRSRLDSLFGTTAWQPTNQIVASGTIELQHPAQPGWSEADLLTRRTAAADAVRLWRANNPDELPHVRVALPKGPGSRLLFALIRASWNAIGVTAERVGMDDDADMRLIDEVAPSQGATWYLRHFTCERSPLCSEAADEALELARTTTDPIERSARIADADLRLLELVAFIPIAQPLRWSLVAPQLSGFQTNIRAVHPLNHLRDDKQ